MDISKVISIAGMSGLYKMVAQTKNGLIVESLVDGKRIPTYASHRVSVLEDISIYTSEDTVALKDVFQKIFDKEKGAASIDHKSADAEIKKYFESIVANYDTEKVHLSDMRKVIGWYNILQKTDLLTAKPEAEGEEKIVAEEKPKVAPKAKPASAPKAKTSAGVKKAAGVRKTGTAQSLMAVIKNSILISKPAADEYAPYFQSYINRVGDQDLFKLLNSQILSLQSLVSEISEEQENFRYADGKWTIKEVIGHILDTERIMAYRALCIARGDKTSFPGFDENEYVKHANFAHRSLYDLVHEFAITREANLQLFKSFDQVAINQVGLANNNKVSVRALLYIIAGHYLHHVEVIRAKYLS